MLSHSLYANKTGVNSINLEAHFRQKKLAFHFSEQTKIQVSPLQNENLLKKAERMILFY